MGPERYGQKKLCHGWADARHATYQADLLVFAPEACRRMSSCTISSWRLLSALRAHRIVITSSRSAPLTLAIVPTIASHSLTFSSASSESTGPSPSCLLYTSPSPRDS